jgi:hypothetical protein
MSVDPNTLKEYDKIRFGGDVVKEVAYVRKYPNPKDSMVGIVSFNDGTSLYYIDSLWRMAELVKPCLPRSLYLAILKPDGIYDIWNGSCNPSQLLGLLRHDVAELEAAGVGKEEE